MIIKSFSEAIEYLDQLKPKKFYKKFSGELGLERCKYLLELLGSPQNKLKVIHIAGTSGKGSTAYLISILLKAHGFKVGLHISPHLFDIRERFQINNNIISKSDFIKYLNSLIKYIQKVENSKFGKPTYFEVLVVLAFYIFMKEQVDYAVVETGIGGLLDNTNCVDREDKISVITRIGLDHTKVLGKTYEDIAFQKAGIINKKSNAIVLEDKLTSDTIEKSAKKISAHLFWINRGDNFNKVRVSTKLTRFNFSFRGFVMRDISLSLLGEFQAENCSMALATVKLLSARDRFKMKEDKVRECLGKARFPGRLEIFKLEGRTVILDGAHNKQKMSCLLNSLQKIFPRQKFDSILAYKSSPQYLDYLTLIAPIAGSIYFTNPFVVNRTKEQLDVIEKKLENKLMNLGVSNYKITHNLKEALEDMLNRGKHILVITGSLFLVDIFYSIKASYDKDYK
ncbi:hypothetical protein JW766_04790 [Candidatus Dojkabacteria bacterium]|nr:hypothetical protein [Candidatus Dojkabacteria bacterium]